MRWAEKRKEGGRRGSVSMRGVFEGGEITKSWASRRGASIKRGGRGGSASGVMP